MDELMSVLKQFGITGPDIKTVQITNGNINDTYWINLGGNRPKALAYLLQRINHNVFKTPEQVMENIINLTAFLREKIRDEGGDPARETLHFLPTLDGNYLYHSPKGDYWRICYYIKGARTYQTAQNPKHLYYAGKAYGKFLRLLSDYPAQSLYETIPGFHNTPKRVTSLIEAVNNDPVNRAVNAKKEIDFLLKRQDIASLVVDMLDENLIPTRVTHNDTKFNNVLIDKKSGVGICVIDLDTVMPGAALYDFGDAIRSGANPGGEEALDSDEVKLDLELFEQYTRGYLEQAACTLSKTEIDFLAFSARLITFELASRFLADHINGDKYFKTENESQNLRRAKNQIKLLHDMEQKFDIMNNIVQKHH